MEAQSQKKRLPPVHFKSFSERSFFVHGVVAFNASLVWSELDPLIFILKGVEGRHPWSSVDLLPQVQGIQIADARVVRSHGMHAVVIRFHPAETMIRGDRLHAYSKYLAILGDELANLNIPGMTLIDLTMEITSMATTYGSDEWIAELHKRLTSAEESRLHTLRQ